jgi:hypothetical protein
MSSLKKWISAALLVAEAEGMANEEVIPTWPADCVERFPDRFPQLTVGALREWQATSAQDSGAVPDGYAVVDAEGEFHFIINAGDHPGDSVFLCHEHINDAESTDPEFANTLSVKPINIGSPSPQQPSAVVPVATEHMLNEGVRALITGLKAFPENYEQVVSNVWEDMAASLEQE